jgi:hypothetical protein
MKTSKRSANRYRTGSPQYVVAHARWQIARGRRPSAVLFSQGRFITNPRVALEQALTELELMNIECQDEATFDDLFETLLLIACDRLCRVRTFYRQATIVITPLTTRQSILEKLPNLTRDLT